MGRPKNGTAQLAVPNYAPEVTPAIMPATVPETKEDVTPDVSSITLKVTGPNKGGLEVGYIRTFSEAENGKDWKQKASDWKEKFNAREL